MPRSRPRPSFARRALILVVVAVFCVVAAGAGVAGGRVLAKQEQTTTVYVDGDGTRQKVRLLGPQTVASVLIMAGVVARDGRLLSVKQHKVLDASVHPATIAVDGLAATPTTPVLDGMTVVVSKGSDEVEGTITATNVLPAPPLPDVLRHVHRRGKPGLGRELRGERSGELVSRTVLVRPTDPVRVTDKVVALTIDDGPSTQWTRAMLGVLASRRVKATFCEVGRLVARHPELSREVLSAGHQLCNHTLDHVERLDVAPHGQVEQQIGGGAKAQTSRGLPRPVYYRPPGGSLGPDVIATAHAHGEAVLFWRIDTEDWKTKATPESILANVKAEVDPGAIILMHDGGGKSRVVSVLTMGLVIDWLRSQGYSFVFPVLD